LIRSGFSCIYAQYHHIKNFIHKKLIILLLMILYTKYNCIQ